MANEEHLSILNQGVEVWNQWRQDNPTAKPDLSDADLSAVNLIEINSRDGNLSFAEPDKVDTRLADFYYASFMEGHLTDGNLIEADLIYVNLSGANLNGANLSDVNLLAANLSDASVIFANLNGADLRHANFSHADFSYTSLTSANLSSANLSSANFRDVNLRAANLSFANLSYINLSSANLRDANLLDVNLRAANLSSANLRATDLSSAKLGWTLLGNVDMSEAKGLESIIHRGPSTIGIDTIYRSKGNISHKFLIDAGVPQDDIAYLLSLAGKAFDFYSCFISYSSQDKAFAERLHADLQAKGVRTWYAPEDLKIGEVMLSGIDKGIQLHDKLLVVLSEHSVTSKWVEHEVEAAFYEESQPERKTQVLFPIRLDDAVMDTKVNWAYRIRQRHIGNFTQWQDYSNYQKAFERLLHDLKMGEKG